MRWVISGIPGPPFGPLVPEDDDVARLDAAVRDRAERVLLAVEHLRRPAMAVAGLVRDLDHRAVGSEIAPEHGVPARSA